MNNKLIIRPEAEQDLSEIFRWYENKRKGLGYDFLLLADAGIRFIEQYPLTFPEKYRNTRYYLIKRFPYKILYRINEDAKEVIILGVIHSGRDPKWMKKRINGNN